MMIEANDTSLAHKTMVTVQYFVSIARPAEFQFNDLLLTIGLFFARFWRGFDVGQTLPFVVSID